MHVLGTIERVKDQKRAKKVISEVTRVKHLSKVA